MEARCVGLSIGGFRIPPRVESAHSSPLGFSPLRRRVSAAGGARKVWLFAKGEGDGGGVSDGQSKGQQLWRKELQSSDEVGTFDDEILQTLSLEKDIQRLAKEEEVKKELSRPYDRRGEDESAEKRGILMRNVVEKILVADFFFILFILAWLVAGVGEQTFLKSAKLVDAWLPLWPSVFQPALGIFMAGAIVSAVTKKTKP